MIEAQQLRRTLAEESGATPTLLKIDKGPAAYKRILDRLVAAEAGDS